MRTSNRKTIFVAGLIAITIVYSLYNIYLVDVNYYEAIPRKVRHINRLGVILIVYAIGTIVIRRFALKWMMQLWHLVYINLIIILLGIGLYDWAMGVASEQIRNIANTLNEFLISPVLFVCVGILRWRVVG